MEMYQVYDLSSFVFAVVKVVMELARDCVLSELQHATQLTSPLADRHGETNVWCYSS